MNNQLGSFLKAVDTAACQWFGEYGGALQAVGFALTLTKTPLSAGVGYGLLLANAAAEKGCEFDQDKTAPSIGGTDVGVIYCYKKSQAGGNLIGFNSKGEYRLTIRDNASDVEITKVWRPTANEVQFSSVDALGNQIGGRFTYGGELYIGWGDQDNCLAYRDPNDPQPLEPPNPPPVIYTDPDNGCEMNITFKGYAEGPGGSVYQITQVEPGNISETKAGGGVIRACNFNPTIVVNKIGGGGGGPGGGGGGGGIDDPVTFPVPNPDPGDNWWEKYVPGAIAGVVSGVVEEIIENALSTTYPEIIYRAVSVCEKDKDGEDISESVAIPIVALKAPDAQIARLDAIVELLQAHKNFKQPVCGKTKPVLKGAWVTTRWKSDETMDHSGKRLRKLFRYRTESARDVGQLSAYWCDFVWRAGNVCVFHKGAWWGTPQVWAESEEEGRRVIRFAASEAGLDPDQIGEWGTSGSSTPRYGMPGTMRIQQFEGYPWVAKRDGPDWPNYLASPSSP